MNIDVDCHNEDTISVDTLYLEHKLRDERLKEVAKLKTLGKTVCNLHTNILYYRNATTKRGAVCYEVWKSLVKKIGGSPNTWRELGYALGVAQDDLNADFIVPIITPGCISIRVLLHQGCAMQLCYEDVKSSLRKYVTVSTNAMLCIECRELARAAHSMHP